MPELTAPAEATPITPVETGDVATPETAVEETPSTEQVTPETETETQAEATEGADQAQISSEQIKSHIEELKKTNPALAKELKTLFFAQDALRKEFPGGLPAIRQLKTTVDELGGAEGIEAMKAERAEWHGIDDKFAAGDPSVLDDFAKENPESFAKLIPGALDKLAQLDRPTYDHTLATIFSETLDKWRFADTLESVAATMANIVDKDGNPLLGREVQALSKLFQQYEGINKLAQNAPKKTVDAEQTKIEKERAQIAQERATIASEYVGQATQTHAQKQYETLLASESKNQKLNMETMKAAGSYDRMMRQLDEEVAREMMKDQASCQKIGSSISAGRRDEAVKLANSKFDAIVGKVVQRVVREWATLLNPRGIAGKQPPKPGAAAVPAGVKKLEEAPDVSLVDKSSPTWRDDYLKSTAKLTSGQRVQW